MGWFTDLISGGASTLLDSAGKIIDDLVTSDEERLDARNRLESIINDYESKVLEAQSKLDKEITERLRIDMTSDSWLSKNVRPLMLAVTAGTIYLLVYLTVFTSLTELQIRVLEGWIPMIVGLFGVMVSFYFGSRGFEKISNIKNKG